MANKWVLIGISAVLLASCDLSTPKSNIGEFSYDLINNEGIKIGDITIESADPRGVKLVVKASAIAPGAHGIHFHHTGACVTPDFTSAGGHINPGGKAHGLDNPEGPDNADMPNAISGEDGSLNYQTVNDRVSISGTDALPALLDENGSALVIHANPDDGKTQPIGGAGARIACAVIK